MMTVGDREEERVTSLANLIKPRDADSSRLRDALRDEKQRSRQVLDTCRELQLKVYAAYHSAIQKSDLSKFFGFFSQVNELSSKLQESERRSRSMEELTEELAAARLRNSVLSQQISERTLQAIATIGMGSSDSAPTNPIDNLILVCFQ